MKNFILFSMPGNEQLTNKISKKLGIKIGAIETRNFPDSETYIRICADVSNKHVILIDGLEQPNQKILPLVFTAKTIKKLGAKKICLVSPYLPYMRQDKEFKAGEAVTSTLFASLISECINHLITIDPHLHRIKALSQIYPIETSVLHSTKGIADWVSRNVDLPFILGPDEESKQWVDTVAKLISAPYAIIKKTRQGDREVSLTLPDIYVKDTNITPVLVDDIISTGTSMVAAIQQLIKKGFKNPICIAVHAMFVDEAYKSLLGAGAQKIVTCNTIQHVSNDIDISNLIIEEISNLK